MKVKYNSEGWCDECGCGAALSLTIGRDVIKLCILHAETLMRKLETFVGGSIDDNAKTNLSPSAVQTADCPKV